eukprot:TRINITY_DN3787_c0_g2_i1.p1 TRINITY_DN3787_c0_g2~~TRINITY_DN3787_c0_g2_i1.p1  ORF type:complete len:189 (-),score=12.56 TRINITY_DN3787_c0_g2_i1:580-1146(-)
MASRPLVTLVASLLLVAIASNAAVRPAVAAPTVAQFRAELTSLRKTVVANKNYSQFSKAIDSMLAYSDKDMPRMFNSTILVPLNKALFKLGIGTLKNTTAMTTIGKFNVLQQRLGAQQLLAIPAGRLLPTKLPNQPLQRTKAQAKGQISLGVPQSAAATWGLVVTPNLFNGKWLKAHGMSVYFKPAKM